MTLKGHLYSFIELDPVVKSQFEETKKEELDLKKKKKCVCVCVCVFV